MTLFCTRRRPCPRCALLQREERDHLPVQLCPVTTRTASWPQQEPTHCDGGLRGRWCSTTRSTTDDQRCCTCSTAGAPTSPAPEVVVTGKMTRVDRDKGPSELFITVEGEEYRQAVLHPGRRLPGGR
ncbi:MAG: hypothetical protein ACLU9S_04700 [Oscillospiraceae bacterium]